MHVDYAEDQTDGTVQGAEEEKVGVFLRTDNTGGCDVRGVSGRPSIGPP